ncbi:MAG: MBL fold metallo-hydrolase [Anaerolineae bacterium]|nr:MBL fold metallo-hydrolase [Anaerolineae bacterium]
MHPFAELTVPQGAVGIHWFEQNAYALKDSQGTVLLIDPYFPMSRPAEKFIRPQPPVVEAEFPVDYVLVTHRHSDHTNPETLTRIHAAWPDVILIGPPESVAQVLRETPVDADHTITINAGESVVVGEIVIQAFWSKPPQGDPAAGIAPPDVTHLGYVIEMEGIRLYVTGDAINTFAGHDDLIAPIAALKPDIGFLTTHPTEGEFPFFEDSVRLAQKLGLKTAVPAHYACFAKRTYDPRAWAALFPAGGPQPLIIPWNSHIVYSPEEPA